MLPTATEFQLQLLRWQFFATFTWRGGKLGSVASRSRDLFEFLRERYAEFGHSLGSRCFVVRFERGELGDRPHAHALLAGFPRATIADAFYYMHCWNEEYGYSKFARYDPQQLGDAIGYVSKVPRSGGEGMRYELRKFDRADRMIVSPAAWRAMCVAVGAPASTKQHQTF